MGLLSTGDRGESESVTGLTWNDCGVELERVNATGVIPKPFSVPFLSLLPSRHLMPSSTDPSRHMSSLPTRRSTFLIFMVPLAGGFEVYAVVTLEVAWVGVLIKNAAWLPEL